jgi:hypothetical protein
MGSQDDADFRRDRGDTEKPATLAVMIGIVSLATRMMVGRSMVHVDGADIVLVLGQAMRGNASWAEGQDGSRSCQAKCIQSDKQACHTPTPPSG